MNPFNYCLGVTNLGDAQIKRLNDFQLSQSDFYETQRMVESDPERFAEFLRTTFQLRNGRVVQ